MAEDFVRAVELGLQLTKRIYYGKEPPEPQEMDRKVPTAPMVYAVISDPAIVENPDIPSYQPYVHGRCAPPALIPLEMHAMAVEVEVCLDTAFVTVRGAWRVHCVSASKRCDCRIAVPMGEQGSVLGVAIETPSRSYFTDLIAPDESDDPFKLANPKDGFLLGRQIYTLQVPQVVGGTILSVKARWTQKVLYQEGQVSLTVPFRFPATVNPIEKKKGKKEKIILNVKSGVGTAICCQSASHPLLESNSLAGNVGFLYERDVPMWSTNDFVFSYTVSSVESFGGVLVKSPSQHDLDQRNMFCLYLYPPHDIPKKLFRKDFVFVVDTSGSMQGRPMEHVKTSLRSALSKLGPEDTFNIIAFNDTTLPFSSKMEPSTEENVENAIQWISLNVVPNGSTNLSWALDQAMKMVSIPRHSIPVLFIITDGAVEDERQICEVIRGQLLKGGTNGPRICTFGIGYYCNHYFLQMLASIGRGYYDAAYDTESISSRLERLFDNSSFLADIKIDALQHLNSLELYPNSITDLLCGILPFIVYGRYNGDFPDKVKVKGTLPDSTGFEMGVKVHRVTDFPLERVFAGREIGVLTAQAWLTQRKELEKKVVKLSLLTGVPSEYTRMVLVESDKGIMHHIKPETLKEVMASDVNIRKTTCLRGTGVGFGDLKATAENLLPGAAEAKLLHGAEAAAFAARCCSRAADGCCCSMCLLQVCSKLSDRCAVALTQLCAALACFECLSVCCELCA